MKKFIIFSVIFLAAAAFAADVKEADLAGSWYPADKAELAGMLNGYLKAANPPKVEGDIFAIISPHAGYQFSGPVAAYGFKAAQYKSIKTVILIGFSHRQRFSGISVYNKGAIRTPLGDIQIDERLANEIISENPRIVFNPSLFDEENSVELEIPFIQIAFKDARVVPIVFGTQAFDDAVILADALAKALKDRSDYLIIASTDLSHYHPYDKACETDKHTISLLEKMDARGLYDEATLGMSELCGFMPVSAVLLTAEKLGFSNIKILRYANSGDTFGDKNRVVGYVSAAIYKNGSRQKIEEGGMLNSGQKKRLLEIARQSITSYVRDGKHKQFTEKDPLLNEPMGAFVTLHEAGRLRGCIGNMVGRGPLYKTVADMAIESATGDPRFPALSPQEIDKVDIEISALSPLKKVASASEIKIPGHGVIVKRGFASGVYLPQVATETGWSKEQFLTSLCAEKAGLPPDAWKDPSTEMYIFTAEVFGEKGENR